MPENKLTRIQEVLVHQERQIQDLSAMIVRQWDEIDVLKKHVRILQGRVEDIADVASGQPANEKPPHY